MVIVLSLAAGCGKAAERAPPPRRPARRRPARPARGAGLPVAVSAAASGAIASYYKATATLEAEKEAQVLARVAGVVEALLVEEGDQVARGRAAAARSTTTSTGCALTQAAARTANLRARFERLQADGGARNWPPTRSSRPREGDLAAAEADEGLARLNLSYTTVTAPFAGRVTRRLVERGPEPSASARRCSRWPTSTRCWRRVHVPAKEFRKLRADQPVELVLDSGGTAPAAGASSWSARSSTRTSGTIKVTIEIPTVSRRRRAPATSPQVRIVTERHDGALLVPRVGRAHRKGRGRRLRGGRGRRTRRAPRGRGLGFTDDDERRDPDRRGRGRAGRRQGAALAQARRAAEDPRRRRARPSPPRPREAR